MARLTKFEKETVFRAVAKMDELIEKDALLAADFTNDEKKELNSARLKMRMELYGF